MRADLTKAQQRMLARTPKDWERWGRSRSDPHFSMNRTRIVLQRLGLIEIAVIPPRWRLTDSGLALLKSLNEEGDNG